MVIQFWVIRKDSAWNSDDDLPKVLLGLEVDKYSLFLLRNMIFIVHLAALG